jgi:hypothetical protein
MAISLNRSTCKDPVNFVISILSPAFFFVDARRSLGRETRLTPTDTTSLTSRMTIHIRKESAWSDAATFQGSSCSMRLIGCWAIVARTIRR